MKTRGNSPRIDPAATAKRSVRIESEHDRLQPRCGESHRAGQAEGQVVHGQHALRLGGPRHDPRQDDGGQGEEIAADGERQVEPEKISQAGMLVLIAGLFFQERLRERP